MAISAAIPISLQDRYSFCGVICFDNTAGAGQGDALIIGGIEHNRLNNRFKYGLLSHPLHDEVSPSSPLCSLASTKKSVEASG